MTPGFPKIYILVVGLESDFCYEHYAHSSTCPAIGCQYRKLRNSEASPASGMFSRFTQCTGTK